MYPRKKITYFPWFPHGFPRGFPIRISVPSMVKKSPQAPQVLALDSAPVEVAGASQA